jgi:hypothetical protein
MPSFRIAQMQEQSRWKEYRKHLGKSDRKVFDELFDASRLYISSCACSAKPVRIHPIFMAMAFHIYKLGRQQAG